MTSRDKATPVAFRKALMQWDATDNDREMPWKGEKDPYRIWLSEIILQQTRVEQGLGYYQRFVERYPTIISLAAAKDEEVFKLWEGLGYYSRCKNLLATARTIASDLGGRFPDTYEAILQLKGVGPYTAAAISSFAFDRPHAVLDGNVYRVLARYFGIDTATDSTAGKALFTKLADDCLDRKAPGRYNQAIMDLGATVCTPASPFCGRCKLSKTCVAYKEGKVAVLPVKGKKLKVRSRWFTYFIIETDQGTLVRKRTLKDIWQDLHEFYLFEDTTATVWEPRSIKAFLKERFETAFTIEGQYGPFEQKLTHQTIHTVFIRARATTAFDPPEGYFHCSPEDMSGLAFPKSINQFLQQGGHQFSLW